jgi:hypothetical protein
LTRSRTEHNTSPSATARSRGTNHGGFNAKIGD